MLIAKQTDTQKRPTPKTSSRCCPASPIATGLVAGTTGTGKTVTLQVIAEALSRIGAVAPERQAAYWAAY